ncbi:hypothetical protein P368_11800 [Comamonas thiooxydans]|nr:hypothetical protein P369_10535 [Comamonas thiooxydans]KGG98418.1 hypothetical protein P367_12800 [Comamonas thiooxydans]KGH04195.1 hypothetical protein P365_13975 [Comamonas thiooxydans]KGH12499.1 hypothetical protein P368_11800 [Comamonas thiooxydans]
MKSRTKRELFLTDSDQATTSFDLSRNCLTKVEFRDTWHPPTVAGLHHLSTSINDT